MIGGEAAAVARARPVLEAMGNAERLVHVGAAFSRRSTMLTMLAKRIASLFFAFVVVFDKFVIDRRARC